MLDDDRNMSWSDISWDAEIMEPAIPTTAPALAASAGNPAKQVPSLVEVRSRYTLAA